MGIRKFLQFFSKFFEDTFVGQLSGKKVAIDGFVWMHKAVYSGLELAYNPSGKKFVEYFMKNIKIFLKHNVKIVVVFDGDKLRIKNKEVEKRVYVKQQNMRKAEEIKGVNIGRYLKKVIGTLDITHDMVKKVIEELDKEKIEYIVAPYEADAELAYLSKIGYVDYIVTEDSDLCAYNINKVLFKFDRDKESFKMIRTSEIISKMFISYDQFLEFCILCGCDFFNLNGWGIKTAYKQIIKYDNFLCIPQPDKSKKTREFYMAKYTFLNQNVYCPVERIMKHINNLDLVDYEQRNKEIENTIFKYIESHEEMMEYLTGKHKDGLTATLIAKGKIPPSAQTYKSYFPETDGEYYFCNEDQ